MANPITCLNCFVEPKRIIDGIPVNARTLQPILDTLNANSKYLKSVLDYFQAPSALTKCVEVNPSAVVGQPVFYSAVTGRYEMSAYGTIEIDGRVYLASTAEVWGIVVDRPTSNTALILVDGIYPVNLSNVYTGSLDGTRLYLSTTAGELTNIPPSDVNPVYVCTSSADGTILFRPHANEGASFLQWKHPLVTSAAGVATLSLDNRKLTISTADPTAPGWLPAGHAALPGPAPSGAVFGYNIDKDPTLKAMWPPIELGLVHLDFDRGIQPTVGGTSVPIGPTGLAIVDTNTIWWLSDCVEDCPFGLYGATPSNEGGCPRSLRKNLTVYSVKPGAANTELGAGGVRSIGSQYDPLKIRRKGSSSAATDGQVELFLNLGEMSSVVAATSNGIAIKGVRDNLFQYGLVVDRLKAGTGVTIESTVSDGTHHSGTVTISADGIAQREIAPQTVALRRAEEETFNNSIAIGLPDRRDSGYRAQFYIPYGGEAGISVRYKLWAMAKANTSISSGLTESLDLNYRRITTPSPSTDIASGFDSPLPLGTLSIEHGKMFEIQSDVFSVAPGEVVYMDISRPVRTSNYEIHILKHFLFIESSSNTTPAPQTTSSTTVSPTSTSTSTSTSTASPTSTSTTVGPTTTTTTTTSTTTTSTSTTTAAPGPGACCLPDRTCIPGVTQDACISLGGTFRGVGTDCSSACPPGEAAPCNWTCSYMWTDGNWVLISGWPPEPECMCPSAPLRDGLYEGEIVNMQAY